VIQNWLTPYQMRMLTKKKKKMNVRLAAQTISSGVADAFDFLC
jgi:hypothetical protein